MAVPNPVQLRTLPQLNMGQPPEGAVPVAVEAAAPVSDPDQAQAQARTA